EFEAVLGVEAFRLHDVEHDRREYRQRQAADPDLRLVLRRGWCDRRHNRQGKRQSGRREKTTNSGNHRPLPLAYAGTTQTRACAVEKSYYDVICTQTKCLRICCSFGCHRDPSGCRGRVMPHLTMKDGVSLYYEESGHGTPVVFVHEYAADYRTW